MTKRFMVWLLASLLAVAALAQTEPPDALVERVSREVLAILQERKGQTGTPEAVALVREKILPHFDFERMTALATGLGWRNATEAQQKTLIEEFRTLLVRTYSAALTRYDDQTFEFKPARLSPDGRKAQVRSLLRQGGAPPITIDYRMATRESGWKIYDLLVDGVSLITTYRDAFAQEVTSGGVDGLIRMLSDKNAELAAKDT